MTHKFLGERMNGLWENQRRSVMHLQWQDGCIAGYFRSAVGLPSINETFDLRGLVNADRLNIVVNFDRYGFVTYWTGQLCIHGGVELIRSDWIMVNEDHRPYWNSQYTGADVFRRIIY